MESSVLAKDRAVFRLPISALAEIYWTCSIHVAPPPTTYSTGRQTKSDGRILRCYYYLAHKARLIYSLDTAFIYYRRDLESWMVFDEPST
jgi:hypothetical protein